MRKQSLFRNRVLLFGLATAAAALLAAASASAAPQYKLKLLHAFCKLQGCTDGNVPDGGLLLDQGGNVYGAASGGKYNQCGRIGCGVVFKLAPSGTRYAEYVLHNFCKPNSCNGVYYPVGDLIMDKNGVLYGVAGSCGGFEGGGTIFSLTHGAKGWGLRALHSFPADEYICYGLAYKGLESGAPWDGTSPLFGVTDSGGKYQNGYVYELKPSGWTFTDIHNFQTSSNPSRPLVDSAGNVFGTTIYGGKYGGGLMYKLAAGTWTESILKNFCSQAGCADGANPSGKLLMDAAGNLFTMTRTGGLGGCNDGDGCGVISERTAGGSYKVLYKFCSLANCADGADPADAGLIMDNAGHIFGTTFGGGSALHCASQFDGGCGVAFELTQSGGSWSEAVVHPFCNWDNCGDGGRPEASLVLDGAGDLFGTASAFGAHGDYETGGTVFELIPQ